MSGTASSSVSITALAVLENGQLIDNSGKTYIFDAQLFLPDEGLDNSILAALRFYNQDNMHFPDVGTYIIHASVCKELSHGSVQLSLFIGIPLQVVRMEPGVDVRSSAVDVERYQLLGDIDWVRKLCYHRPSFLLTSVFC